MKEMTSFSAVSSYLPSLKKPLLNILTLNRYLLVTPQYSQCKIQYKQIKLKESLSLMVGVIIYLHVTGMCFDGLHSYLLPEYFAC